jgi:hypothetical protein
MACAGLGVTGVRAVRCEAKLLLSLVAVFTTAAVSGLPAQGRLVEPGDSVRLWIAGSPPSLILGRLTVITLDSVTLMTVGDQHRYPRSLIAEVHRYQRPQRVLFAVLWSVLGASSGTLLAIGPPPDYRWAPAEGITLGVLGAGLGAALGVWIAEVSAGWKAARFP